MQTSRTTREKTYKGRVDQNFKIPRVVAWYIHIQKGLHDMKIFSIAATEFLANRYPTEGLISCGVRYDLIIEI
jgi:hypothetical protein